MSRAARGVVAAGDPQTAEAGARSLRAGGSAIDAAVGAAAAAFVCEAPLCAPLGGGVLVRRGPTGTPAALDLFARVPGLGADGPPAALDFRAIEVDFGATTQVFHVGRGSAAVPLLLDGLVAAHRRWGRLPLSEVLAPAVELGRDGYVVGRNTAYAGRLLSPIAQLSPEAAALYVDAADPRPGGFRMHNRPLADVLEALGREPATLNALHEALLGEFGRGAGGLFTPEDFVALDFAPTAPVASSYEGWDVFTAPDPSSGGVLVALGLRLLEGLPTEVESGSPAHALRLAEVQRALLELRAAGLGGVSFDDAVRDPGLVRALFDEANLGRVRARLGTAPRELDNRHGSTTQISVIDGEGAAVGLTVTNGEGCGFCLADSGIQVNNLLGEEDINPRGFHVDPPGHRLVTMMAPTIAVRGADVVVLGSGGSNRLRNAITAALVELVGYGHPPAVAVEAPRLHVEGGANGFTVAYERPDRSAACAAAIEAAFPGGAAAFDERNMFFGGVHLAARLDGRFTGAGDPRRGGACVVA